MIAINSNNFAKSAKQKQKKNKKKEYHLLNGKMNLHVLVITVNKCINDRKLQKKNLTKYINCKIYLKEFN